MIVDKKGEVMMKHYHYKDNFYSFNHDMFIELFNKKQKKDKLKIWKNN